MKRAIVVALLWAAIAYAQGPISATDAKNHVGEKATVCGRVASARYAMKSSGSPTFIDLDRAYPPQIFTIVIWGGDRRKFGISLNVFQQEKRLREWTNNLVPRGAGNHGPRTIANHNSISSASAG